MVCVGTWTIWWWSKEPTFRVDPRPSGAVYPNVSVSHLEMGVEEPFSPFRPLLESKNFQTYPLEHTPLGCPWYLVNGLNHPYISRL